MTSQARPLHRQYGAVLGHRDVRTIRAACGGRVRSVALGLVLAASSTVSAQFRIVALAEVATTTHTHVCTRGPVVFVRRQSDGDVHLTLDDGRGRVVAEIIPQIPLPVPVKGQRIDVCGITRIDRAHRTARFPEGWPEIHPVTSWRAR